MTVFQIAARSWCGWLETPPGFPGWAASPILIESVQPLKTGQGKLKLGFLQPLHAGGGRRREVVLKIVQHTSGHFVGAFENDGVKCTAIVSAISFDWLESYCATYFARRPPTQSSLMIDGVPLDGMDITDYLATTFGQSENEILTGATAESFGAERMAMPAMTSTFSLGVTVPLFESLLIARGCVPQAMEDKWFIYMEDSHLIFRRSWTGILIYRVEAIWRSAELYLGEVRVNRDPEQYSETSDAHDKALLQWLIDVVLRRVPSEYPVEAEDDDRAPLQAWASAGKASLT